MVVHADWTDGHCVLEDTRGAVSTTVQTSKDLCFGAASGGAGKLAEAGPNRVHVLQNELRGDASAKQGRIAICRRDCKES